jgi:hypothetical protein
VRRRIAAVTGVCVVAVAAAAASALMPHGRERPALAFPAAAKRPEFTSTAPIHRVRDLAVRQARVWMPAPSPTMDLAANPPDPTGLLSADVVRCRYRDGAARGTTPKFDCVLANGEIVKVKYGFTGEIPAEIGASRLLAALGFGADRMFAVRRLRCYGCLAMPFYATWAMDHLGARDWVARRIPEGSYSDFSQVAVERRFDGYEIPDDDGRDDGWGWFELDAIDPARGANRAERDALRLIALLLSHWDNKASNQRLVCLDRHPAADGTCARPFAYIHDLGATFGPNKVDLEHWRGARVWADPSRCTVSMHELPYGGGTFPDVAISEAGRQMAIRLLSTLDDDRLRALFAGARFHGDPDEWARTFREKARAIGDAGPCGGATPSS